MGDSAHDAYEEARYTAEISTRMQVPDKISLAGSPAHRHDPQQQHYNGAQQQQQVNDLGMRKRDPRVDMQVPDRILVSGNNAHIASKSTPRELQLDAAVLPPTLDSIRVTTPPRSIRLDEVSFPSAADEQSLSTPTFEAAGPGGHGDGYGYEARRSSAATSAAASESNLMKDTSVSLALMSEREPLPPSEEIQLVRRQLAKLNHRLMAVELENQQQQQREMVLTFLVGAYFLGKVVVWINRSL